MTCLNVTITPERAVMTQDRGLYVDQAAPMDTAPTADLEAASATTFTGNGERSTGRKLGEVDKITPFPSRRFLVGASGGYAHTRLLPVVISVQLPEGDISDIAEKLPAVLQNLVDTVSSAGVDELLVIVAGWSAREGRALGYAYERSQGFAPIRLDAGHTHMPVVNPSAPGYQALTQEWMDALEGRNIEAFHRSLLANQFWSYENGLLRQGGHLTPSYSIGSVDEGGVRLDHRHTVNASDRPTAA